jgi:hypothetical protein
MNKEIKLARMHIFTLRVKAIMNFSGFDGNRFFFAGIVWRVAYNAMLRKTESEEKSPVFNRNRIKVGPADYLS